VNQELVFGGFGKEKCLINYSAPLSGAEKIGGFENGPLCHVDAWPDLQKVIPELVDYDYSGEISQSSARN